MTVLRQTIGARVPLSQFLFTIPLSPRNSSFGFADNLNPAK